MLFAFVLSPVYAHICGSNEIVKEAEVLVWQTGKQVLTVVVLNPAGNEAWHSSTLLLSLHALVEWGGESKESFYVLYVKEQFNNWK